MKDKIFLLCSAVGFVMILGSAGALDGEATVELVINPLFSGLVLLLIGYVGLGGLRYEKGR